MQIVRTEYLFCADTKYNIFRKGRTRMKRIKKTIVCLMCMVILGGITGCGNNAANGGTENGTVNDATSGENYNNNGADGTNGVNGTNDRNGDGIVDDAVDDVTDGVDDVTDGITDGVDRATDDLTDENGAQRDMQNNK